MVRGAKKKEENGAAAAEANPEAEERKRLKRLAFSNNLLSSESPPKAAASVALSPSRTVMKHHGRDILRKSQRKNRFLFSFPGLLGPISGGKIGELKDLGTKNPILYLHFPQGQMKLFGTIVYPKNRYLTLQFSRGGKNVMCEDYFDTMIVFSDAWWIGRKDENPEEARLEFPQELNVEQHAEYDFKGGAGATCERKQSVNKPGMKCVEQQSPKTEIDDDLSDSQNDLKELIEVTPTRQSARTAGKAFNFAEASSGDDSVENNAGSSEGEEKKTENSCCVVFDIDNVDVAAQTNISEQVQQSPISVTKSKELSHGNQSSLVQATISTMFKKVEKKKVPRNLRNSLSAKVSGKNLQHSDSKQKTNQVKAGVRRKKGKAIEEIKPGAEGSTVRKKQHENLKSVDSFKVYKRKSKGLAASAASVPTKGQASSFANPTGSSQIVEEDDIEEISSTSQDTDGSDEDWAA